MKQQIHPTARDLELLRHIGQRGVSSTAAIHRAFWAGRQMQTAQDRLDLLATAGYLQHQVVIRRDQAHHVYALGRKAAALFSEAERRGFLLKPAVGELGHLLRTGEVVDWLQATRQVTGFVHEHALRSAIRHGAQRGLADAQVTLDGLQTLLEIDSIHYTGQRLRQKVADLGQADRPVLWVVGSQARLKTVSQVALDQTNIEVVLYGAD
jgi:hypothetical protein